MQSEFTVFFTVKDFAPSRLSLSFRGLREIKIIIFHSVPLGGTAAESPEKLRGQAVPLGKSLTPAIRRTVLSRSEFV